MDLVNIFNAYFDIIFVRAEGASVVAAMLMSGASFLLLYLLMPVPLYLLTRRVAQTRQATLRPLLVGQMRREVQSSFVSILMFALLGGVTAWGLQQDILSVTGNVSRVTWVLEVLVLYLWNELHFFLCHRLLHWKPLYKTVHIEHHRTITVTPLACWRFHFLEALLLGSVMPLIMLVHDFSVWSLLMLPILSLFWNVVGHSNLVSASGNGWLSHASRRHALHHTRFHGNYGFSVVWLDRWLNSELR